VSCFEICDDEVIQTATWILRAFRQLLEIATRRTDEVYDQRALNEVCACVGCVCGVCVGCVGCVCGVQIPI
jgi:hypothetical protein